jgi:carboxyl-terminal processing protease
MRLVVLVGFALSVALLPFCRVFADEETSNRLFEDNRQAYLVGQRNFYQIVHHIRQRYEDPNVDLRKLYARGLYEAEHLVSRVEGATEVITLATYTPAPGLNDLDYVRRIGGLIESRMRIASATVTSITELWNTTLFFMVNGLGDPYTQYLPPRNYDDLQRFLSGESDPSDQVIGVGIHIEWDYSNTGVLVVEPVPGSPAFLAHIRPGDVIVAVDDIPLSTTGTPQENLEAAMKRIQGPEGTKVKLTIRRPGTGPFPINYALERRPIHQQQLLRKEMLDQSIAWLKLWSFYQNCSADMRDALLWLNSMGMKKLILDLRQNPGGFLDEAVRIADLFLPQGALITYTQGRTQETRANFFDQATDDEGFTQIPVVILVDAFSASASEVVTGALKDSDRARVVGVKTFGKGSVQELFQLDGNAGLRLTVAKYYTPKGRCIHDLGIEPDVQVEYVRPETAGAGEGDEDTSDSKATAAPVKYNSRLEMLIATDNQLRTAYQLLNPDLAAVH